MFANLPTIGVYKAETDIRRDFEGLLKHEWQVNEEILKTDPDAASTTPARSLKTLTMQWRPTVSTTPLLALSGTLAALVIVATIGALARACCGAGGAAIARLLPHSAWWSRLGLRGDGARALQGLCIAVLPWIPGMDFAIAVRVLAVPFISTTVLTGQASSRRVGRPSTGSASAILSKNVSHKIDCGHLVRRQ